MDRYDEVNAFVQCEINSKLHRVVLHVTSYWYILSTHLIDTHISIGGVVIEVFENAVGPLINTSLQLANRECSRTF